MVEETLDQKTAPGRGLLLKTCLGPIVRPSGRDKCLSDYDCTLHDIRVNCTLKG